jgi:hypothetical protein
MVDGAIEARQAHGRIVPIELRRTPQRRLPAMEPQWQPNGRSGKRHIATKQRARAGEATTAEVEEHVPEAILRLCRCRVPESSRSSAREAEGRRRCIAQRQPQERENTLLVDEEVVHR